MTTVSEHALNFLKQILMDPRIPATIKNGITNRLGTATTRETELRTAIAIVKDPSRTNSERLTALHTIIAYAKGER